MNPHSHLDTLQSMKEAGDLQKALDTVAKVLEQKMEKLLKYGARKETIGGKCYMVFPDEE
jgi:ribosome-associated translation inhibitor RaiA